MSEDAKGGSSKTQPYTPWYEPTGPGPAAYFKAANSLPTSFKVNKTQGNGTFGSRTFIRQPGQDPYVYTTGESGTVTKKKKEYKLPELPNYWKNNKHFTMGKRPVTLPPDSGPGYKYNSGKDFGKGAPAKSMSSRHPMPSNGECIPVFRRDPATNELVKVERKVPEADVMKAFKYTQPSSPQYTLPARTYQRAAGEEPAYQATFDLKAPPTQKVPALVKPKGPSMGRRFPTLPPEPSPGPGTYNVEAKKQLKSDKKHPTLGTRAGFIPVSYMSSRTARLTMLREDITMNQNRTGDFSFTQ